MSTLNILKEQCGNLAENEYINLETRMERYLSTREYSLSM